MDLFSASGRFGRRERRTAGPGRPQSNARTNRGDALALDFEVHVAPAAGVAGRISLGATGAAPWPSARGPAAAGFHAVMDLAFIAARCPSPSERRAHAPGRSRWR